MVDTLERLSRDNKCWSQRFHYNWPNINAMMQQSEITINQQVIDHSEQLDTFGKSHQIEAIPEWNGQDPPNWKAWGLADSDISTNESLSTPTCGRKCNKACRSILCVLLFISFVIAVVAAVGLSIFLTQFNNKLTDHSNGHSHGGTHEDVDLSTNQQKVLTKIFCGTIEDLLAKSDFPVKNGLKDCYTSILFIEKTGSIHIEMHATPVEGYTIKEKIIRALTEKKFNKSKNRIKEVDNTTLHANKRLSTLQTNKRLSTLQTNKRLSTTQTNKRLSEDSTSVVTTPTKQTFTDNENGPTTTQVNSRDLNTKEITTAEESLPSVSTEFIRLSTTPVSIPKQDSTTELKLTTKSNTFVPILLSTEFVDYLPPATTTKQPTRTKQTFTDNENGSTITPVNSRDLHTKVITPAEESLPSIATEFVRLSTTHVSVPKQDSTTEVKRTTETNTLVPILLSTEFVDNLFTETTTKQPIYIKPVTTADVKSSGNKVSVFKVPVATNLFQPTINEAEFNNSSENKLNSLSIRRPSNRSPKVVESLMAGGVIRLPLRTNSNFRFLFSGNSGAASQTNQPKVNNNEVKVAIRKPSQTTS